MCVVSPRWPSGNNPRIVLVLEFEFRRDEILNLFLKKYKNDQLLRACSVGKAQFDASRRGKEYTAEIFSRSKCNAQTVAVTRGGESVMLSLIHI